MSDVLLNLDTLVVRPKINIDGSPYEILSPDELPVLTTHMLAQKGKRMEELMNQGVLNQKEERELKSIVNEISDAIMEPVPAEIRAKLTDVHRTAVVQAFSMLMLTNKAGAASALMSKLTVPTMSPPAPPTGGKRSRGSSASTADRRAGGSTKHRSRS